MLAMNERDAENLRHSLVNSGYKKSDNLVIKDAGDEADKLCSLTDILEMIEDVNIPVDYFETHIIYEKWECTEIENLPTYWIPVSKDIVVERVRRQTIDLINEMLYKANPRRISLIALTVEALKNATIKDIPQEK